MLPSPAKMFTEYGLIMSDERLPHRAPETLARYCRHHLEANAM